jgi:6-pyruvoyl-tetrahydropterin synthase
MSSSFSIQVAKENLKFSAAHFIAYPGFREPLHGHNYQMGVKVEGRLGAMGYVLDFGVVKKLLKEIADRLDEQRGKQVRVLYEVDEFVFPAQDVALLPIMHSSAEELARFVWNELCGALRDRGVINEMLALEVWVAEGPGQSAHYRQDLPRS